MFYIFPVVNPCPHNHINDNLKWNLQIVWGKNTNILNISFKFCLILAFDHAKVVAYLLHVLSAPINHAHWQTAAGNHRFGEHHLYANRKWRKLFCWIDTRFLHAEIVIKTTVANINKTKQYGLSYSMGDLRKGLCTTSKRICPI